MMSRLLSSRTCVPLFMAALAVVLAGGPSGVVAAQRMVIAEDFTATW